MDYKKKKKLIFWAIIVALMVFLILIIFIPWKSSSQIYNGREFILKNGQLFLQQDNLTVWRTNPEWQVKLFRIGDIDKDGQNELLVVLNKPGYYGPDLPFWEDENIDDWGNHLFVYNLENGIPKIQWGSSTIPYEIWDLQIKNGDLVVNGGETIMQWRDFVFFEK